LQRKKAVIRLIQVEKLKTMTQLALYEKKQGKQDFSVFRYRREDYIHFEKIKTVIAATAAFLIIGGFLAAWNIEVILSHFDTYNYKQIGAVILVAYIVFLIFYKNCGEPESGAIQYSSSADEEISSESESDDSIL
jgi:hypothetical protein